VFTIVPQILVQILMSSLRTAKTSPQGRHQNLQFPGCFAPESALSVDGQAQILLQKISVQDNFFHMDRL